MVKCSKTFIKRTARNALVRAYFGDKFLKSKTKVQELRYAKGSVDNIIYRRRKRKKLEEKNMVKSTKKGCFIIILLIVTSSFLFGLKPTPEGVGGATKIKFPLSNKNLQHITKHTIQGIKEQAKHLTDSQLAKKLKDTSFFNPKWSKAKVNKYVQEAYNTLRLEGKTGLNTYKVGGETIEIFIHPDGSFGSAYGHYNFTIKDIR